MQQSASMNTRRRTSWCKCWLIIVHSQRRLTDRKKTSRRKSPVSTSWGNLILLLRANEKIYCRLQYSVIPYLTHSLKGGLTLDYTVEMASFHACAVCKPIQQRNPKETVTDEKRSCVKPALKLHSTWLSNNVRTLAAVLNDHKINLPINRTPVRCINLSRNVDFITA